MGRSGARMIVLTNSLSSQGPGDVLSNVASRDASVRPWKKETRNKYDGHDPVSPRRSWWPYSKGLHVMCVARRCRHIPDFQKTARLRGRSDVPIHVKPMRWKLCARAATSCSPPWHCKPTRGHTVADTCRSSMGGKVQGGGTVSHEHSFSRGGQKRSPLPWHGSRGRAERGSLGTPGIQADQRTV